MHTMNGQIVVVEDEPGVADLLRDILEPEGYSVLHISHPDDAYNLEPTLDPDLIMMDLMLPRLDGVKLAGLLRERGFKPTPMVAMSASRIMLHLAAESGLFQTTLSKPFELNDLLACVEENAGRYVTSLAG